MRRIMVDIPPKWKQLWLTLDLRGFIILSLSLQTFLILAAPFRKRTKSNWLVMPLWFAYLLADWAANFAVGLISNSQGDPNESHGKKGNQDLLAFWAPFLLVHLGGPDTITAFALEDNELWLRHLLGLLFQCIAAVYVFVQSLPQNGLWIPTMLMFITGIIKYTERTRSLYLASADIFKDSMLTEANPGLNYAKLMGQYHSSKEAKLPTRIQMIPEFDRAAKSRNKEAKSANKAKRGSLTELEQVQYGYQFFVTFKGLVVDLIFSRRERKQSRDFFLNRTAKDAFKVVEIELNFIYDILFTKLPVVFGKEFHKTGFMSRLKMRFISRFFSFATICAAIVFFIFKNKTNFTTADVTITYSLLFGALVLDLIALLMLIFSDWMIITIRESPDVELDKSFKTRFYSAILRLMTEGTLWDTKNRAQSKIIVPKNTQSEINVPENNQPETIQSEMNVPKNTHPETKVSKKTRKWTTNIFKRRWSESVLSYNLIYYCLHPRSSLWPSFCDNVGLGSFFDEITYVKANSFTDELRDFIFEELKAKSELADDLQTEKKIGSARGDWVIVTEDGWLSLLKYVVEVDYDKSLILWHIATELCYNKDLQKENAPNPVVNSHRYISKVLSDYMLYLLIMQPSMMSAVADIGQIFRDTCAETRRLLESERVVEVEDEESQIEKSNNLKYDRDQIEACINILDVSTEVPPEIIKGYSSKSLLFDSCILAKELQEIEDKDATKNKWFIISKVWVELLCYAASHTRANTQAAQVSKGGELITIVWLLMAHFGFGDHFQINEFQGTGKLIVGK